MTPIELKRRDDTVVVLRPLSTNAIVALEEALGQPFGALLAEVGAFGFHQVRLATVRHFLHAAIASPELSLDEVGQLMDEVGVDAIAKTINRALVITADAPSATRASGRRKAKG